MTHAFPSLGCLNSVLHQFGQLKVCTVAEPRMNFHNTVAFRLNESRVSFMTICPSITRGRLSCTTSSWTLTLAHTQELSANTKVTHHENGSSFLSQVVKAVCTLYCGIWARSHLIVEQVKKSIEMFRFYNIFSSSG